MRTRNTLKLSYIDLFFYSVMNGFTAEYIQAYAVTKNATKSVIANIQALPGMLSSISQIFSSSITGLMKNRKNFIATSAMLQGVILILLSMLLNGTNWSVYITLVCLISIAGNILSPAWFDLIGGLLPPKKRGSYFGLRNSLVNIFTLIFSIIAGILLDFNERFYSILFLIAGIARIFSAITLYFHSERRLHLEKNKKPLVELFGFYVFRFLFLFSVSISAPFINLYLLNELKLSYIKFSIVINSATISALFSYIFAGRLLDRIGARKMIVISSMGITLVPFLWLMSGWWIYLCFVQIFAGFVWAGFGLAIQQYIYETIEGSRITAFGTANFLSGTGGFIGANIGAFILPLLPAVNGSEVLGVFIVSGIMRLLTLLLLKKI